MGVYLEDQIPRKNYWLPYRGYILCQEWHNHWHVLAHNFYNFCSNARRFHNDHKSHERRSFDQRYKVVRRISNISYCFIKLFF